MRAYEGSCDFLKVRDFLKTSYYSFGKPTNWGLERWNWGRYHPLVFCGDRAAHIRHFEDSIRIWEKTSGEIIAILNTENPEPNGEAWIQRLPEADPLLGEILARAEGSMAEPGSGILRVEVYDHDLALTKAVEGRGYARGEWTNHWSEILIDGEVEPALEPGFRIRSMADPGSRIDLRCEAMGRGFNHPDPADWSTPEEFLLVQSAPDYPRDRDLVVEAPDGEYVSLCIAWYDDYNRFGVFEPVCTHPDYRRRGFGKAVIREGLNRLYRLGARKAYVGSGQEFYAAIGFTTRYPSHTWVKKTR
jgi:GNAT superfamily N-acetyltransferase